MPFLQRLLNYRWLFVILILVALPFTSYGALQAWMSNSNRIGDWLSDDNEVGRQLDEFFELFGSDELLMISWRGCTLSDQRIAAYAHELSRPMQGGQPYFRDVVTGPQVLDLLRSEPVSASRENALSRMQGWILSRDSQTTCLVARVSEAGYLDRPAAIAHAKDSADRVEGLSSDTIFMAGTTLEGVEIDRASSEDLVELNVLSFLVCLVIMVVCLRSFRAAAVVFLSAIFNEQIALALVYAWGTNLDSILLLTANLTFVLTISIGIHLVNYYRDAQLTASPVDAPAAALLVAIKPTAIATITTALGLVSLTVSQVKPLIRFGGFSSVSILIATLITLVCVAAHFRIWPLRVPSSRGPDETPAKTEESLWMKRLNRLRWPIVIFAFTSLFLGFLGARQLRTTIGLTEILSPETRIIQDYSWLEKTIGPLYPVEIVVPMPPTKEKTKENAREILRQFRVASQLHQSLSEIDKNYVVVSSSTFSPQPPPEKGGLRQIVQAAAFGRRLLESQEELMRLGYLRGDEKSNYWRISMQTPATRSVNYGDLLQRIRNTVDRIVQSENIVRPQKVLICGSVPVVHQVQEQLLKDLINSGLLAFAMICVVLMFLFRSFYCGLICMIPNVFPIAVVFGFMGWWDISVEIGSILTASAAMGIAVDDSLHFITWFRRKVSDGGTISQAVAYAYRRCGMAMLQTTLICSFGLVVFSASQFTPISRFGWSMFSLLTIALVADLIILPAILLSPLGRPFIPKNSRPGSPAPGESQ